LAGLKSRCTTITGPCAYPGAAQSGPANGRNSPNLRQPPEVAAFNGKLVP
jgi:hypothetical protein